MAIPLNTHQISSIYACNQWFHVKQGSLFIDAYNLRFYLDEAGSSANEYERPATDFELGALYEDVQPEYRSGDYGSASHKTWCVPSGSAALCFIDANTGERISFSICEVTAFKENPDWPC
jgi:hypothetical protein